MQTWERCIALFSPRGEGGDGAESDSPDVETLIEFIPMDHERLREDHREHDYVPREVPLLLMRQELPKHEKDQSGIQESKLLKPRAWTLTLSRHTRTTSRSFST